MKHVLKFLFAEHGYADARGGADGGVVGRVANQGALAEMLAFGQARDHSLAFLIPPNHFDFTLLNEISKICTIPLLEEDVAGLE